MGLLLLTYALGVLTVPALIAAALLVFWLTAPDSDLPSGHADMPKIAPTQHLKSPALTSPYSGRRTGWLRITRSLDTCLTEPSDGQTKLTDMVTRGIAKWIHGKRNDTKRTDNKPAGNGTLEGTQDAYYVVLDGDTLVMYDGEAMNECRGVIVMSEYRVTLHHRKNVTESQVYSRRTPIRLSPANNSVGAQMCIRQVAEYYMYADRPTDKEDWYFALLWSSLAYGLPEAGDYDKANGHDSIASLDSTGKGNPNANVGMPGALNESSEKGDGIKLHSDTEQKPPRLTWEQREQLQLRMRRSCMVPDYSGINAVLETISKRGVSSNAGAVHEDEWLNAVLGRTFIGVYRTEWVRQHFMRKMQTKFDRVDRPMFLERVVVADLDVGDHVPVITNPKLESFSADGQVDVSMYMHYMGGFRLVLDTAVKLGALRLSISLSVVLQSLAGKMLLRFKPAPSNRFWLGFYEMPRINLKVSPVFMQKQVKYAVVSQAIEKQIYDMVRLSLVLPNLDDTVFFPTLLEDGAILERSLKEYKDKGLDAAYDEDDADEHVSQSTESAVSVDGGSRRNTISESEHTSSTPQLASDQTHITPGTNAASVSERSTAALGGIVGNTSAAFLESRSPSRFAMTTPSSISDDSPGSSHESLAGMKPMGRGIAANRTSSSNLSTSSFSAASSSKPPSVASSISISAASLLKRAKASQAAESAKSWWQNIQQNGFSGDSAQKSSVDVSAKTEAPNDQIDKRQRANSSIYHHKLPEISVDAEEAPSTMSNLRSQSLSPPPLQSNHISTPPRVATGEGPMHSKTTKIPQLNDSCGGASSSIYNNRSSMVADSLLVRRRAAVPAQSNEVELTSPRRTPKLTGESKKSSQGSKLAFT
ncbi:hypothetical protein IWW36_000020 [Coemansia brasiliensis]|uniref:SMP-LTD domain-containing protein n=1 Tax=Coemansia brasiliensis TaxID=2650707 RepID=A0A9W8II09_9FUNG|nr:hypothetical protein IWW36_000020 [Coemansia brasiliensis]